MKGPDENGLGGDAESSFLSCCSKGVVEDTGVKEDPGLEPSFVIVSFWSWKDKFGFVGVVLVAFDVKLITFVLGAFCHLVRRC